MICELAGKGHKKEINPRERHATTQHATASGYGLVIGPFILRLSSDHVSNPLLPMRRAPPGRGLAGPSSGCVCAFHGQFASRCGLCAHLAYLFPDHDRSRTAMRTPPPTGRMRSSWLKQPTSMPLRSISPMPRVTSRALPMPSRWPPR